MIRHHNFVSLSFVAGCTVIQFLSFVASSGMSASLFYATCLSSGKGLTLVGSVIEGDFMTNKDKAEDVKASIVEEMKREKAKGFAEVIITKDVAEGLSYL